MRTLFLVVTFALIASSAMGQVFDEAAFVGTWEGYYSSPNGGSYFPMTLDVEADGFYTDSSGHLMPPYYYPDTQTWEYDEATNRLHFRYLGTVYGGQYFYDHFFYEVVAYTGDTIEVHYNYWDDPEPHPQWGTIVLQRVGTSAVSENTVMPRADLSTNFPNPFNPITTIAFTLTEEAFVSLEVFDLRGNNLATLVSGRLQGGEYNRTWQADGLASGTYFYRLQVDDYIETHKMSLVR